MTNSFKSIINKISTKVIRLNYLEAIEQIARANLVSRICKKIDSGFFPNEELRFKLKTVQNTIDNQKHEIGFWTVIEFIKTELLSIASEETLKSIEPEMIELKSIFEQLENQKTVDAKLKAIGFAKHTTLFTY